MTAETRTHDNHETLREVVYCKCQCESVSNALPTGWYRPYIQEMEEGIGEISVRHFGFVNPIILSRDGIIRLDPF
jgi:hypothetical protein